MKVLEHRFFTSEHHHHQQTPCRVNPFLWLLTREPARQLSSGYVFSCSTARLHLLTLIQVFMTRRETLQCVHEPFGDAYYFGPERLAERYEDDEQARKESGYSESTYRTIFDRIARENSEVRTSQVAKFYNLQHTLSTGSGFDQNPPIGIPFTTPSSLDRPLCLSHTLCTASKDLRYFVASLRKQALV